MQDCHRQSISLIEKFIGKLQTLNKVSALEVAAGDARLSKDLLVSKF